MADWTKLMNQPESEPTRQDRINEVASRLRNQTGKSYTEVATVLEERAEDASIQQMVAGHAEVMDVSANELRAAAAHMREIADNPLYQDN